jgi:hypothetical protein
MFKETTMHRIAATQAIATVKSVRPAPFTTHPAPRRAPARTHSSGSVQVLVMVVATLLAVSLAGWLIASGLSHELVFIHR